MTKITKQILWYKMLNFAFLQLPLNSYTIIAFTMTKPKSQVVQYCISIFENRTKYKFPRSKNKT